MLAQSYWGGRVVPGSTGIHQCTVSPLEWLAVWGMGEDCENKRE